MTENAIADCWIMIERPVAAAMVCTKTPNESPNEIRIPFLRPCVKLSVKTKILSGPGIMVNKIEASKNESINPVDILF